ncbi:MAG: hypothetical protein ACRDPJ_06090 [Nocardioidaceae bacterium]
MKLLAGLSAAVLVAVLTPSSAQASHSWGNYHWARTSNPFTLKLGDNLSSNWDSYLGTTSSDWSKSTVLDTTIVAGSTSPRTCKATAGRVEVCNATYGNNGWLGIASISVTGGVHITQGTVKLNDTYFNTATYNTSAWRNLVTCQEVGHTFGLDHQDEVFDNPNLGTCMDYTNNPSTNQHPNQHDYDQLVSIYSHLDSTTTVGMAAPSRQPQVGNDPSSWGKHVEGSRAEGHSTYVRDFGNGKSVVTFVTWA